MKTIENRKAFYDFQILKKFEAGIALKGSEVKSIREGQVDLKGSYVGFSAGNAILFGMYVKPYSKSSQEIDPKRERKILLHKKEIISLATSIQQKNLTVVPLKIYFNKRGFVKMEIGLARARKKADKRDLLKEKQAYKEMRKFKK